MLGVDERGQAARLLGVGDDVQHEGGLAGGFRAKDLDHASARNATHAQRQVHGQRAGGDDLDLPERTRVAQAHDAAVAVGLGDGGNGGVQVALTRGGSFGGLGGFRFRRGRFLSNPFDSFRWHILVMVGRRNLIPIGADSEPLRSSRQLRPEPRRFVEYSSAAFAAREAAKP